MDAGDAATTRAALPALQARLLALHPYELPDLLAVETADGLPASLRWIADNVAAAPRAHDSGE